MKSNVDLVIIGGGPAGMSAAVSAYENGIRDILILERDSLLGGILQQCIHNGFGLHKFNEELTGPEYAWKYEEKVRELEIPFKLNTMVLEISKDKKVTAINSEDGIFTIQAKAIILAMGCRERPKGALNISGSRPAGIFTAGTAQKFVNMKGYMPGKNVVILGSGDIGLIMARRMTLEGAKVKAVCELMPYSGGLERNIEQCLRDFDIPLKLSCTVAEIHGKDRLEGVTIASVDANRRIIPETKEYIECDTLLLSVGLLPENELTKSSGIEIDPITSGAFVNQDRETMIDGIFACGNVLHVHDLVDNVSEEAEIAGRASAEYILQGNEKNIDILVKTDGRVRYCVPQRITRKDDTTLFFRVSNIYENVRIYVSHNGKEILSKKKIKVAPGEMESILLKKSCLEGIDSGELVLGLEVL
ncbi:MAG: NAD(P)/FAD-dependent oxidoreductase [Clostridia bacterium]|nr:NAD(P)/FAD-dependent oxidoreductase [Clostridia bacterium]